MPLFEYKIINNKGFVVEGTANSISKDELAASLKSDNQKLLSIKLLDAPGTIRISRNISLIEKANLFRFLSTMLKAGLSISEGAEVIKEETQSNKMKNLLNNLAYESRRGSNIATILAKYPEDFDPVIIAIIKVGEETGSLDDSFSYLATELSSQYEMNQKIKGSLAYPGVIVAAMLGIGMFMVVWVLPKIASSFMKLNIELPFYTKIIMNFGVFVGENTLIFMAISVGLMLLTVFLFLLKPVKKIITGLVTAIGPVKRVLYQIDLARYAQTLSTLTKRGVPIVEALNITADTLNVPKFRNVAKTFGENIAKGLSISEVMSQNGKVFPPAMIQTIKAGEKTGMLDRVLSELAQFYNGEVDRSLKKLTTLLEPVIILFVGIAVGAMVVMMIAPIYNVIGSLQSTIEH